MEIGLNNGQSGFADIYPMKLYEKGQELAPMPCDVLEIEVSQDYEIPDEPIESGVYISDTQYLKPKNLRLRVFVSNENITGFERDLKAAQTSQNGFIIIDREGAKFSDFWLTAWNKGGEFNDGYHYDLSLREVIRVQGFNSAITTAKTSNAGLSSKQNNGEQNAKRKQSALKGIKDAL